VPDGLYELTGGNPFFVTEMLRAGLTGEVPATARDAVLARAAGLSGEARQALETAALIGGRIDPRLLDAAVDEVVTAGLLVGDGPSLRFRHELTRLAVEQSIPAHRVGRIHASILAGLRALDGDDDARMAYHAEGARDEPAVLHYAVRAARRAAELASHREAAAQYERAVAKQRGYADAWRGLGESRVSLGDQAGAAAAFEALVTINPGDALALMELGQVYRDQNRVADAVRVMRDATQRDPGPAAYWNALGTVLGASGQMAEAERAFSEATSREGGNGLFVYNQAIALEQLGRRDEAVARYRRAAELGYALAQARLRQLGAGTR